MQQITQNERLCIAVVIYCGLIWKLTFHMYYTKNILFSTPGVPPMMPQQKFVLIESIYILQTALHLLHSMVIELKLHQFLIILLIQIFTAVEEMPILETINNIYINTLVSD